MTLIKHYYIDNKVGIASSRSKRDLRYERIEGLNVIHVLEDENGYPYMLSQCPENFEFTEIVDEGNLQNLQNDISVGIVTYAGFTTTTPWGPIRGNVYEVLRYNVTYTKEHDLSQYSSLEVIDQETFNGITSAHDDMQHVRRVTLLNDIKSTLNTRINNFVSHLIDEGVITVPQELTQEFKDWRNIIVNLGNIGFPKRLPPPPPETHGNPTFPAQDYPQYQIRKDLVIRRQYRRWFLLYEYKKVIEDLDSPSDILSEAPDAYDEET